MKSALIGLVLLSLVIFFGARRSDKPTCLLPKKPTSFHEELAAPITAAQPPAVVPASPALVAAPITEDLSYATEFLAAFDAARHSFYDQQLMLTGTMKSTGPTMPGQAQRPSDSKPIRYTLVKPDSLQNKIYVQILADSSVPWAQQFEPIDLTVPSTELLIETRRHVVETSYPKGNWERFQGRTPNEFIDVYTFDHIRGDGVHVTSHVQIRVVPFTKHFLNVGEPAECSHQLYTQIARISSQTPGK